MMKLILFNIGYLEMEYILYIQFVKFVVVLFRILVLCGYRVELNVNSFQVRKVDIFRGIFYKDQGF